MGLCLLELFNGASFNGARTLLMGLTLLQMFNGVLSANQAFNGALSSRLLDHITTEK